MTQLTQLDTRDAMRQTDMYPPAVHILGAPKCGTTALAAYLADHSQIAFSAPKETHHYSSDIAGLKRSTDDASYQAMFTVTEQTKVLMEASVWYLYSQTAIPAILKDRPDAKFIVMLRNPVKMLPSLHLQLQFAMDEDETDFRTAWNLSDARAKGDNIPKTCRAPSTLLYKETAAYGAMLDRLFALVPRDRVKVFFQEEMAGDTQGIYQDTLAFMGIDDDRRTDFARINEAKTAKSRYLQYIITRAGPIRRAISSPIKKLTGKSSLGVLQSAKRWNSEKAGKLEIPQDLQEEIAAHYADDMAHVGELLGKDLNALGWPVAK